MFYFNNHGVDQSSAVRLFGSPASGVHRRHVECLQQSEHAFVGAVEVGGAAEEGLGRK